MVLSKRELGFTSSVVLDSWLSFRKLDKLSIVGVFVQFFNLKGSLCGKNHCSAIAGTRRKVILEKEYGPRPFLSQNQRSFADLSLWPFPPNQGSVPLIPRVIFAVTHSFPFSPRWFKKKNSRLFFQNFNFLSVNTNLDFFCKTQLKCALVFEALPDFLVFTKYTLWFY